MIVVGDWPLREAHERASSDLGIARWTKFHPFVPHQDLPAYYRSADVTVIPSDFLETFCMVALEAIACGSALVVTDQVPEILRRFPEVPSVKPYDVEGLRDRIDAALEGRVAPADRRPIADYDWDGIAGRYAGFYRTAQRCAG